MGKKKQFIDKKKAVSFLLVHRSQRDPLQADEESSKHVLFPVDTTGAETDSPDSNEGLVVEDRIKQQQECGVFFEDNYDYLQHLKPKTETHLEPLPSNITVIKANNLEKKKFGNLTLPGEAFASSYEENEGLLSLGTSVSGPRPDWDPDIVAALDDAIDLDDPDNILDDNFILKANGDIGEESENVDRSGIEGSYGKIDDQDYFSSDEDHFEGDGDEETKSRFSNYSMTSSVIRRTQGLCLLDDRFDKIMEEYDDDEIGALDNEEVSGDKSMEDPLLESIKNQMLGQKVQISEALKVKQNKVSFDLVEDEKSSDEKHVLVRVSEKPKEQWDCESILSTYSNLYNHPTLIKESLTKSGNKRISLSKREGIPLGVLSDGKMANGSEPQCEETRRSRVDHARSREETREEKKSRKQSVKQERQMRRAEKKTNTLLFKEERKRQEKSVTSSALLVGQKIE